MRAWLGVGAVLAGLLCGRAHAATLEKTFAFGALSLSAKGDYHSIELEGARTLNKAPGLPLLPVKTVRFLLGPSQAVERVEVIAGDKTFAGAGFRLEFGRERRTINSPSPEPARPDQDVYASTRPYLEGALYSAVRVDGLAGYRIATLILHPVEYIPATGVVSSLRTMTVRLTTRDVPLSPEIPVREDDSDKARVAELVENPSAIGDYRAVRPAAPKGVLSAYAGAATGDRRYIIITSRDLKPTFERLAAWKREAGLTTHIQTVEDIKASYGGKDDQEKIRGFVKYAYSNWGTSYVVLGGDVDIIPARYMKVDGTQMPCDMYYGALDGDWDKDGDGNYGEAASDDGATGGLSGEEADLYAEVFVGRIPAGTAKRAQNQIDKIIAYERGSKNRRVLLIGEYLKDDEYGSQVLNLSSKPFPSTWKKTKLYSTSSRTVTEEQMIKKMNTGTFDVVHHSGHTGQYFMGFATQRVSEVTTTTPFLIYSLGCDTNAFDKGDPISEHFTVGSANGAFAYIGFARESSYQPIGENSGSTGLARQFFESIFTKGVHELGKALQKSKEEFAGGAADGYSDDRWHYFQLNLLGDPQTRLGDTVSGTPPSQVASVNDGEGADIDSTDSKTQLSANWAASSDAESGVASYWYAIGTSAGATDVVDWTDNGSETKVTKTGLSLDDGQRYYFTVKAANGAGVSGEPSNSDGQRVEDVSDGSRYLSSRVPKTMTAGREYLVAFRFKNTGGSTWNSDYSLALTGASGAGWSVTEAALAKTATVRPRRSKTFSFKIRPPSTAGNYSFRWRMRRGSAAFGETSPAREVAVAQAPAAAASAAAPTRGAAAAPRLERISADLEGPSGEGMGTWVTLRGTGFEPGAVVLLAGPVSGAAVAEVLDAGTLRFAIPGPAALARDGAPEPAVDEGPSAAAEDDLFLEGDPSAGGECLVAVQNPDGEQSRILELELGQAGSEAGSGGFGEVFAYPNPAAGGKATIHAEIGASDGLRLRIYDLTSSLVHEANLSGPRGAGINGKPAYEYAWDTSRAAPGAYLYLLEASNGGATFRAARKLAVAR